MPKYFEIVDNTNIIKTKYLKTVFVRREHVEQKVSLARWVWLCALDVLFGEELLENLVVTAGNSGCPEDLDPNRKYGEPMQLSLHIPTGFLTSFALCRNQVIQLLYYKFYMQYEILIPVENPFINMETGTIDVTSVRFRFRKSSLYQIIAFRRVYLLTAFIMNFIPDLVVYLNSNFYFAFIVGVSIESVRRFLKLCL